MLLRTLSATALAARSARTAYRSGSVVPCHTFRAPTYRADPTAPCVHTLSLTRFASTKHLSQISPPTEKHGKERKKAAATRKPRAGPRSAAKGGAESRRATALKPSQDVQNAKGSPTVDASVLSKPHKRDKGADRGAARRQKGESSRKSRSRGRKREAGESANSSESSAGKGSTAKNCPKSRLSQGTAREWRGLAPGRKRLIPVALPASMQSPSELAAAAFETAFCSCLQATQRPVFIAMQLFEAARKHCGSLPFRPSDATYVALVEATLLEAEKTNAISYLSAKGADLACEVMLRSLDVFQVYPGIEAFTAVLQVVAQDPVVERRPERALSIFRFVRSSQLSLTPKFVYECFKVCVAGLDVEAATVVMEFALQSGMFHDPKATNEGPFEIDYYNGVMYSALLMGDFNTVGVAYQELMQRRLQQTVITESVYLALCIERGDETAARILLSAMRKKTDHLDDCLFSSMLRAAGLKRDTESVLGIYREFEKQRDLSTGLVHRIPYQGVNGSWSSRASAAASGNPTFALFQALRVCSAAEESVEQLRYLQDRYQFEPPRALYALVVETCWKGGRLDLARKLRIAIQASQKRRKA